MRKGENRIPRKTYGIILYDYCKKNHIKQFKIRRLRTGWYPELAKVLRVGQAMQACIYLREEGLTRKDGTIWHIK